MKHVAPTSLLRNLWIVSLAAAGTAPGAEEVTYHPKLEKLAFRAPGRVALFDDGSFGCVAQGRFLLSTDEGKSWQPRGEIAVGPGPAVSSGLLVQTRDGSLVLVYRDDKGARLERTADNMPVAGAALRVWCVRSTDGGKTWGDHEQLIAGYCGAMIDAICTRRQQDYRSAPGAPLRPAAHVTVVFTSTDGGKTWNKSRDLDIGGYGLEDGAFEGTVAERRDGSLLLFLRTPRDRIWSRRARIAG